MMENSIRKKTRHVLDYSNEKKLDMLINKTASITNRAMKSIVKSFPREFISKTEVVIAFEILTRLCIKLQSECNDEELLENYLKDFYLQEMHSADEYQILRILWSSWSLDDGIIKQSGV